MGDKYFFKCEACKKRNEVLDSQLFLRLDANKKLLCWQCCRKKNWESPKCAKCRDRVFCNGRFVAEFRNWNQGTNGV